MKRQATIKKKKDLVITIESIVKVTLTITFLRPRKHTVRNVSSGAMAEAENKFKSGKRGVLY